MQFKFKASTVDAIEKATGESIGNAITIVTIGNIAQFIEKALVNDDGRVGVSRSVALNKIDDYLEDETNDLDGLVLDITEALVRDGFLSRDLSVEKMRELKKKRAEDMMNEIDKSLAE